MDPHRYRVGQTVKFVRTANSNVFGGAPPGNFRIVRLLPDYKGDNQYRVESITDNHQRVAIESEIAVQ